MTAWECLNPPRLVKPSAPVPRPRQLAPSPWVADVAVICEHQTYLALSAKGMIWASSASSLIDFRSDEDYGVRKGQILAEI